MTTATENQLVVHIASNNWTFVDTKYPGTDSYDSQIGLLRSMFGFHEDPNCVVTLADHNRLEFWIANQDNNWIQLFSKC